MLALLRRYAVLASSGALLALSLVLLAINTSRPQKIDPLGSIFLELVSPITAGISLVQSSLSNTWGAYVNLVGVRQENQWLRHRVRELEARLTSANDITSQNARLQALLDLRESMPGQAVAARMTSADATGLYRTATLNKGERDGLSRGMAVLAPPGVVGQVVTTSRNAARILLINDRSSGIDALVERTRARGIVEGAGGTGCLLKYVRRREDLQVGDRIVASGMDGIFPKGALIGEVVRLVHKEQGLFLTGEIQPAIDFNRLEEVLVVAVPAREAPPIENRPPPGAARTAAPSESGKESAGKPEPAQTGSRGN